jgi:hypothetical protein
VFLALTSAALAAPPVPNNVTLTVAETAGLRRFGYPVSALVPLPRGAVRETFQLSLVSGVQPVRGVQYDAADRWPDGSLRWVRVSFNLSPAPFEQQQLRLRFGPGVDRRERVETVVQETESAFNIRGVYRLPREGPAFIDSIRYGRREFLRAPAAWSLRTGDGKPIEENEGARRSRVVTPGSVNAIVELSGTYAGKRGPIPYRLIVSQPNSKSWFDAVLALDDRSGEVAEVRLTVPYRVEQMPALYDFGVGSWVYGALREGQAAVLEQPAAGPWRILTGPRYRMTAYAAESPVQPRAEGWAHLIDGAQSGAAVAFGTPDFPGRSGAESCALTVQADGETSIRWHFGPKGGRRRVRALFHHVADPVHVTAATSPPSMLHPLRITLPAAWYRRCGISSSRRVD